jgi:large subunit ribosomal protein L13
MAETKMQTKTGKTSNQTPRTANPGTGKAKTTYVDATHLVVGRMASLVAEKLLKGESVLIANCEKAVFTGNPIRLRQLWQTRLDLRPKGNPETGPRFHRVPDRIVHEIIEGMVPHRRLRGVEAMSRLRVYIGVPPAHKDHKWETLKEAETPRTKGIITVQELAEALGYNGLRR